MKVGGGGIWGSAQGSSLATRGGASEAAWAPWLENSHLGLQVPVAISGWFYR